MAKQSRCGACGDYYGITPEGGDILNLVIQANLYAELLHPALVPRKQVAQLALV